MSLPSPEATLSTQWPSLEGLHALSQNARLITLTTPLPEVVLVAERIHGREAVSELFQFEIDCFSSAAYAQLTQLIGAEVSVQLLQADGSRRHWHGYLTRATQLGSDGSLTRYRLSLAPWLVFLQHRRNTLIFQDKTALEIAQALFADYPQAHFELRVSQPQQEFEIGFAVLSG